MSERKVELKRAGRQVSVVGLSRAEGTALSAALAADGCIDTLLAVGQMQSLTPAQRRLASVLAPEPE